MSSFDSPEEDTIDSLTDWARNKIQEIVRGDARPDMSSSTFMIFAAKVHAEDDIAQSWMSIAEHVVSEYESQQRL